MKKIITIIGLILLIAFTPDYAPKEANVKYIVTLSLQDWQHKIDIIETAKIYLKQSDLPSKVSFPLIDSLTSIQKEFQTQIIPQLPKPPIKDSIKNK